MLCLLRFTPGIFADIPCVLKLFSPGIVFLLDVPISENDWGCTVEVSLLVVAVVTSIAQVCNHTQ